MHFTCKGLHHSYRSKVYFLIFVQRGHLYAVMDVVYRTWGEQCWRISARSVMLFSCTFQFGTGSIAVTALLALGLAPMTDCTNLLSSYHMNLLCISKNHSKQAQKRYFISVFFCLLKN